jgi:tetratricopeptide (TPR) repeat protein
MANIFEQKPRHVVPNFRRFSDTAELGELGLARREQGNALPFDLGDLVRAWEAERSLGLAGDVLSAAIVAGMTKVDAAREAAEFILEQEGVVSSVQQELARGVLGANESITSGHGGELPHLSAFLDAHDGMYERIQRTRRRTIRFPGDPIPFVELARLYSILGLAEKAKKNIRIALAIAPDNRFVLRCAARLFAHYGDIERAHDLLWRNLRTLEDPWLCSAELALASLLGRHGGMIKRGRALIASKKFSPFSLAELSSGLATIELREGNRRRSRDLFRLALVDPNDNALAQVEWAFSRDRLFDLDLEAFDVKRNFEALALEAFRQQEWARVIEQAEAWFMDMPFARRPVMMGSHVASVVLDDYKKAQLFARAGLVAHPGNAQLLNNYAYALALDGKADDALAVLDGVSLSEADELSTRVCLTATRGLAHFRKGEVEQGRRLYEAAIDAASKIPNVNYRHLALVNYAREEILSGQAVSDVVIEKVKGIRLDRGAVTLGILKEKVLSLYERRGGTASSCGNP